jgi:hypothetical protein
MMPLWPKGSEADRTPVNPANDEQMLGRSAQLVPHRFSMFGRQSSYQLNRHDAR